MGLHQDSSRACNFQALNLQQIFENQDYLYVSEVPIPSENFLKTSNRDIEQPLRSIPGSQDDLPQARRKLLPKPSASPESLK